jgi:hypothetical protein
MQIIGRLINNAALLNIAGNIKARIYDNVIPHFFLLLQVQPSNFYLIR